MKRRSFLQGLCTIPVLPLLGCSPVKEKPSAAVSTKKGFAIAIPERDPKALVFAKNFYPMHRIIVVSQSTLGGRYGEILVHPGVWKDTHPRTVEWVNTCLRTRRPPWGRYVEL